MAETARTINDRRLREGRVLTSAKLAEEAASLKRSLDPGVARLLVDDVVRKELAHFQIGRVQSVSPHSEKLVRDDQARIYDDQLAERLVQFRADRAASLKAAQAKRDGSRVIASPKPGMESDLHELLIYRRWEGRTLKELREAYEATTDTDDPQFVELVERLGVRNVGARLKLAAGDDDQAHLDAVQGLDSAIPERQRARQDPAAAAEVEAISALVSGILNTQINLAASDAINGRLNVARQPYVEPQDADAPKAELAV